MQKIFTLLKFLFVVMGISCNGTQNLPASQELFKSSVFTPVNSFTSGAEGPAVDKDGILYAVNFSREGTIGRVTPAGRLVFLSSYRKVALEMESVFPAKAICSLLIIPIIIF